MDREMETTDNTLAAECRTGNTMKFRVLVERYKKPAYFFALNMVDNPDDAYDLSQEAFIKAYRSLETSPGQHKLIWQVTARHGVLRV